MTKSETHLVETSSVQTIPKERESFFDHNPVAIVPRIVKFTADLRQHIMPV
jgi:hypothetical protein